MRAIKKPNLYDETEKWFEIENAMVNTMYETAIVAKTGKDLSLLMAQKARPGSVRTIKYNDRKLRIRNASKVATDQSV